MTEDRFEQSLREAGREYHLPPQTPREEMWVAIEAARRRRGVRRIVRLPVAWRWGLGLAATLLLGIVIGRWMSPRTGQIGVTPPGPAGPAAPDEAYGVAAAQFLSRTETLLAGFRVDARRGPLDSQFVTQARDLLSFTRLLLDSPAGHDPRLKPLLEDLELILVQIASLSGGRTAQDVELINQGIDQRSVLTRLRTALPSGPVAAARAQGVL